MSDIHTIPIQYPANPSVEPQLKRAFLALEDEEDDKARDLFDRILEAAPECALAYLGLAMLNQGAIRVEDFLSFYDIQSSDKNLCRTKQFSDGALKARFEEEERRFRENAARLPQALQRAAEIHGEHGILFADEKHVIAEKPDGSVLATDDSKGLPWGVMEYVQKGKVAEISTRASESNRMRMRLHPNGTTDVVRHYGDSKLDLEEYRWKDIVAAQGCSGIFFAGLRRDGTIRLGDGAFADLKKRVPGWRNIVAFSVTLLRAVGVSVDGRVIAVGSNSHGQCDVSHWRDIVAVACADDYTVGLKSDGTFMVAGKCDFKDKMDGWKLFDSADTLAQERKACTKAKLEEKKAPLRARLLTMDEEEKRLRAELANLKGLFTGSKRRELEAQLSKLATEQSGLVREIDKLDAQIKDL